MVYLRAVGTLAASGRGGARDPGRSRRRTSRGAWRTGHTQLGAENFCLETAAGLGIIWLAVLVNWYVRLIEVGRAVLRVSPRGPMAHGFAPFHLPLVVGLPICNLTGVGIMGPVGIGQVSFVVRDDGPSRTPGG